MSTMTIEPLAPFGAEIKGVDIARADGKTLERVVEVFHRSGAIVLRGQHATPDQLVNFVSQFGPPQVREDDPFRLPQQPAISVLSNRVVNGRPLGAHNDGIGWHTDLSFKERPAMCTMLYAVEVPPVGSDTLLADGVAAYAALPADKREQIDGMQLHHSFVHFMETREFRRRETTDEDRRINPDVVHPLVRTHPADGRRALWPSTGTVKEVIGMPGKPGFDLIDELVGFMTQEQFVYRHRWQAGDILVWDNRCSLHTGTLFDDQQYFRTMYRLWVVGERPQ
ncbi:TauD/TfdA family dioxygenase [soil metagenome]